MPEHTVKTKFYQFTQNNSGGRFTSDEDVAPYVIIEASSAREANSRAEEIGIYFDGVDKGKDCPCCGDRWYPVCENYASEVPEIYGMPVGDYVRSEKYINWADKEKPLVIVYDYDNSKDFYYKDRMK